MHTPPRPQLRDMAHSHTLYPGTKLLPKDTLDGSGYNTLLTAEVTSKATSKEVGTALFSGALGCYHGFINPAKIFTWHFALRVKFSTVKMQQSSTSMITNLVATS